MDSEGNSTERHSTETTLVTEETITVKNPAPYDVIKNVAIKLGCDFDSDSSASLLPKVVYSLLPKTMQCYLPITRSFR